MKLTFNKLSYVPAFALTLGLCGLAMPAMAGQTQSSQSQTQTQHSRHQTKSVTGCLEQGSNGNFTITAKDGQKYELEPNAGVKLASHVNHEVTVRGMVAPASTTSGTGSENSQAGSTTHSASSEQTMHVRSLKMVSTTCQQ